MWVITLDWDQRIEDIKTIEKEFIESIEKFINSILNEAILRIYFRIKEEYWKEYKWNILKLVNQKKVKVVIRKNAWDDTLIKDELWAIWSNLKTWFITFYLNPIAIANHSWWIDNYELTLMSVFCHELAHLLSTELLDNETRKALENYWRKVEETLGDESVKIPNIRYYRSWLSLSYWENRWVLRELNEWMTDIFWETIFNILKEEWLIPNNLWEYVVFYKKDKQELEYDIRKLQEKLQITEDEIYEYFEKAYLLWWFHLSRLLNL
jgi:hypothetical protein